MWNFIVVTLIYLSYDVKYGPQRNAGRLGIYYEIILDILGKSVPQSYILTFIIIQNDIWCSLPPILALFLVLHKLMTSFISVSSIKSILEILRRSRNHLNLQAKIHSSVLFLKYNSHFFMYASFLLLYTNLWLILFLLKFLLILFPQEWNLAIKLYFILLTPWKQRRKQL